MTKNPIINALFAAVYIIFVSAVMFYGTRNLPKQDTFLAPISMISLFTLSAAVMGYLFLYNPLLLFMDGKKKQAIDLFLKTVAFFGLTTGLILALLFSNILR